MSAAANVRRDEYMREEERPPGKEDSEGRRGEEDEAGA